ncbi:MAG: gas vesicle protein [Desulfitobacteriaceae bacterium]
MSEAVKPLAPAYHREATINDLIDRLLVKGVLLKTDLIIGVAGIPLLGVNLNLALAGMSTMLRFGFMRDWDEAIRAYESEQCHRKGANVNLTLQQGEVIIWSGYASHWYEQGIYAAWRPGIMYLTDHRLTLIRQEPYELLIEVPYHEIVKLEFRQNTNFTGVEREELQILLRSGDLHRVYVAELHRVLEFLSRKTDFNMDLMQSDKSVKLSPDWFKAWYRTDANLGGQWRPGEFYVEEGRLLWHTGRKERPLFSLWPPDLLSCKLERIDLALGLTNKPVLQLHYLAQYNSKTACFSGTEEVLSFWHNILQAMQGDELEVCPGCGAPGSIRRLLEEGCGRCGWLSARKQREVKKHHGLC